jgi:hypothetical protein
MKFGGQPHFFWKWKKTSVSLKGKTTSIFF